MADSSFHREIFLFDQDFEENEPTSRLNLLSIIRDSAPPLRSGDVQSASKSCAGDTSAPAVATDFRLDGTAPSLGNLLLFESMVSADHGEKAQAAKDAPPDTPKEQLEIADPLIRQFHAKKLPELLPVVFQLAIEEHLAKLAEDDKQLPAKFGFDPKLSPRLVTALDNPAKAGEDADLRGSIAAALAAKQIRAELVPLLEKFCKQSLTEQDANKLRQLLGVGQIEGGLFKPELIKELLNKEIEAKRWGPASAAIWSAVVLFAAAKVDDSMGYLVQTDVRYLPANVRALYDVPASTSDQAFRQQVKSGHTRSNLGIDVSQSPTVDALEKFFLALQCSNHADNLIKAHARLQAYNHINELLGSMNRTNWRPSEPLTADSEAWKRRSLEVTPIANVYEQIEATHKALEDMVEKRVKGGVDWRGDANLPVQTEWMDEALADLKKLQDDKGRLILPTSLAESEDKRIVMERLQQWLDKYQERTAEQYVQIFELIKNNQFVSYGDRPRIKEVDPEFGKDYNLVRSDFTVELAPRSPYWIVRQETKYAHNTWRPYDIGAPLVRDPVITEMSFKHGQLVPVFEFSTGKLRLIEAQHLAQYHLRARVHHNAGLVGEIAVDGVMCGSGFCKFMAAGRKAAALAAKSAAGGAARFTWGQFVAAGLKHGGLTFGLGLSGVALNNNHWKYDSETGQLLHKMRGTAFVALAVVHVGGIGFRLVGSGLRLASGGKHFVPSAEAGRLAVGWKDLGKAGKGFAAAELGALPFFIALAGKEFHQKCWGKPANGKAASSLSGKDGEKVISGLTSVSPVDVSKNPGRASQPDGAQRRQAYLDTFASTLTSSPGTGAELISKIMDKAKAVLPLEISDRKYQATLAELSDTYMDAEDGSDCKLTAAIALLELTRKPDGTMDDTTLTVLNATELRAYLREATSEKALSEGRLKPEQALAAEKMLLSLGEVSCQCYANLCGHILKLASASDTIKAQAVIGMGLMMSQAINAETTPRTAEEEVQYQALSHGATHAELQAKLLEIVRSKADEINPDLRALAAHVLFAMNRDNPAERVELLSELLTNWNAIDGKPSGTFAQKFDSYMQGMLNSDDLSNRNLAAGVMYEYYSRDSNKRETMAAAIASCVDHDSPKVCAQALSNLLPDRFQKLTLQAKLAVARNAIESLWSDDSNAPETAAIKAEIAANIPLLLQLTNDAELRNAGVEALAGLLNRKCLNFAGAAPDLRYIAVEALGQINDPKARQALESLLSSENNTFVEPDANIRLSAVQGLHKMTPLNDSAANNAFKATLAAYMARETDPRALTAASGIAEQRVEKPIPQAPTFEEQRKRENLAAVLPSLQWDKLKQEAQTFLNANFKHLSKQRYDSQIESWKKLYAGTWSTLQTALAVAPLIPGDGDSLQQVKNRQRDQIETDYISDALRLRRWAMGAFEQGEVATADASTIQIQSMQALAALIKSNGGLPPGPYLRDEDRLFQLALSADVLARLCQPDRDPKVRAEAKNLLLDLLLDANVHPAARCYLVPGLRRLTSEGADKVKRDYLGFAPLTKEEVSQISALALVQARRDNPHEERPEPTDEAAHKDWKMGKNASVRLQVALMESLVYTHHNREAAVPLLESIIKSTSDSSLRQKAELCLTRALGVELRAAGFRESPDTTATSQQRANAIERALARISNSESAQSACDTILQATYGRPFAVDDARIPVLRAAAEHPNELVRLASAYALLSQEAHSAQAHLRYLAASTLIDLERNAADPVVREEARLKLNSLPRFYNKKIEFLENEREKQKTEIEQLKQKSIAAVGSMSIADREEIIRKCNEGIKGWQQTIDDFLKMRDTNSTEGARLLQAERIKNRRAQIGNALSESGRAIRNGDISAANLELEKALKLDQQINGGTASSTALVAAQKLLIQGAAAIRSDTDRDHYRSMIVSVLRCTPTDLKDSVWAQLNGALQRGRHWQAMPSLYAAAFEQMVESGNIDLSIVLKAVVDVDHGKQLRPTLDLIRNVLHQHTEKLSDAERTKFITSNYVGMINDIADVRNTGPDSGDGAKLAGLEQQLKEEVEIAARRGYEADKHAAASFQDYTNALMLNGKLLQVASLALARLQESLAAGKYAEAGEILSLALPAVSDSRKANEILLPLTQGINSYFSSLPAEKREQAALVIYPALLASLRRAQRDLQASTAENGRNSDRAIDNPKEVLQKTCEISTPVLKASMEKQFASANLHVAQMRELAALASVVVPGITQSGEKAEARSLLAKATIKLVSGGCGAEAIDCLESLMSDLGTNAGHHELYCQMLGDSIQALEGGSDANKVSLTQCVDRLRRLVNALKGTGVDESVLKSLEKRLTTLSTR